MKLNSTQRATVQLLEVDEQAIEKLIKKLYNDYYLKRAEHLNEYNKDVEYWARKGYKPHYCEHGVDQWVDHDIPCGACELGEPDELDVHEMAVAKAKDIVTTRRYVADALVNLINVYQGDEEAGEHISALVALAFKEPTI